MQPTTHTAPLQPGEGQKPPGRQGGGGFAIALRECLRMRKNPMYLCCMVLFPVFVCLFFTSLMQEGQPQDMPVGVVDLDNSATTRKLTRMLDSFQSSKVVARYPSFDDARLAMQHNEIYGFLYFPKGTTADLLASRQPTVSYYYSYASLTAGSLVFKDLKTVATLGTAGVGKSVMSAKGYTDSQIATFLQPIAIDLHTVGNPWVNYNVYLSTMLVPTCLLLLIFLVTAYSLGSELKQNTAQELYARAGGNPFAAIFWKMLPQTAVWLAIMAAYMYYTFGVLDFPHPGGWHAIVALGTLAVFAAQGFGVFMFGLFPSMRMAMSMCSLWGVLSFSMVGTAFPTLAMDPSLQAMAQLFPMRHFFIIYEIVVFGGNPWNDVAVNVAALALFTGAPVFVMPRIGKALREYVYME